MGSNDRPRIAVVTPIFPNSAEPFKGIFVYQTVRALQKRADVEVFCPLAKFPRWRAFHPRFFPYQPVDLQYTVPEVKVNFFEYPSFPLLSRPFNGSLSAKRLKPLIEKARPDLILAYWVYPEGYGAVRTGEELGIPVVIGALGSDLRWISDYFTRRMVGKTLRRASGIITVSEELRQRALDYGVPAPRVQAILNGCDDTVFQPAKRSFARYELGLVEAAQVVLFVGRLAPVKGLPDLFDAIARLAPSNPNLGLYCIGEGVLESQLRERAERADLTGRIHFLGRRNPQQIARWMAAANCLALPSYSEGCPNVVLEALSCGLPVVASNVGGIPEVVDPLCSILVPPARPAFLADGLAKALSQNWDQAAIAARNRRTWDDVADETYDFCDSLLPARQEAAAMSFKTQTA